MYSLQLIEYLEKLNGILEDYKIKNVIESLKIVKSYQVNYNNLITQLLYKVQKNNYLYLEKNKLSSNSSDNNENTNEIFQKYDKNNKEIARIIEELNPYIQQLKLTIKPRRFWIGLHELKSQYTDYIKNLTPNNIDTTFENYIHDKFSHLELLYDNFFSFNDNLNYIGALELINCGTEIYTIIYNINNIINRISECLQEKYDDENLGSLSIILESDYTFE